MIILYKYPRRREFTSKQMTNENALSNTNTVSSNYFIISLCLFALLGYTCVVSCMTYLMVIINTPKCQEKINRNEDIEENTEIEETPKLPTTSFIRLYQIVILFMICLLLWITRINIITNQEKSINQQPLFTESVVCNRTKTINELIRIEKKIAFYDIRQHHINVDFKSDMEVSGGGQKRHFVEVLTGKNGYSKELVLEYWIRINNIKSSIFDKKSDELLIYTKDIGKDVRSENVGYTIDNEFIDEVYRSSNGGYGGYVYFLRNAYYLHNKFYEKLKREYKKIEDKYNSLPLNFDFGKLMIDVHINENEMDVLEEFDSKRRKLEIREMILLFDLKPAAFTTYQTLPPHL